MTKLKLGIKISPEFLIDIEQPEWLKQYIKLKQRESISLLEASIMGIKVLELTKEEKYFITAIDAYIQNLELEDEEYYGDE